MHNRQSLRSLIDAVQRLAKAVSLDEASATACHTARRMVGFPTSALLSVDQDDISTCVGISTEDSYDIDLTFGAIFSITDSPLDKCIREKSPVVSRTKVESVSQTTPLPKMGTATFIPVGKAPVQAIIAVFSPDPETEVGEDAIGLLEMLADSVAQALENLQNTEELEQKVEERTLALQAVNEELQSFAYTVSHDLKTPLSVVKTALWTLRQLMSDSADPRTDKCLRRIDSAADRMHAQIDGMLSMYRMTRSEIDPVEIDLTSLCKEILGELTDESPGRKCEFTLQPGLTVHGDAAMIRVAMENLLGNAWKYTARKDITVVEVGLAEVEDNLSAYFVRDNGAGFDMTKADKLFGVFQRLHADEEFSGTGVGLASVQRILHKHGGLVWAEGHPDRGATFFFTMPEATILEDLPEESPALPSLAQN